MGCAAPEALLRIGAVAERSGLSVKTIRFYCDQGLLQPSARSTGRYRLFDPSVLAELVLLRQLRAMDIPLVTIQRVLGARRTGLCTCADLQATLRSKLGEIHRRIEDLQVLERDLEAMLSGWTACGGR